MNEYDRWFMQLRLSECRFQNLIFRFRKNLSGRLESKLLFSSKNKKKMKVAMNLITVLILIMALVSCGDSMRSNRERKMVVRTASAVKEPLQNRWEFSFISAPFRVSELSFRVGGPIDRFEVFAGNYYKSGDVIAEIDARDFRIRKERAEAVYRQMHAEFERIRILHDKKNVSASTFEKAKADYISAKTAYETAVNELNDTRLIAPFDGYVGEVYIEKYQEVKASQPVISFVDINNLKIETYVNQQVLLSKSLNQEVELRFDAIPDRVYKLKIEKISKSTTPNNLSYLLTALLPNQREQLPAGMSGKLSFRPSETIADSNVIIPLKAVWHSPAKEDFVWIVNKEKGRVSRRKITLGKLMPEGKVCIETGMIEGEVVAVSGLRFLSEGMEVHIGDEEYI